MVVKLVFRTVSQVNVCLQGVELNHPRAGSAPAFLHTSAPLGGYGGFGMYSSPYGTAFNTGVRQKLAPDEGLLHMAQYATGFSFERAGNPKLAFSS